MNGLVRFYVNQHGHFNLQQLHKLDGEYAWDNVPVKGIGESESYSVPIGINCGIFFIEEKHFFRSDIYNELKEVKNIYPVSALSIARISEAENNKTRIETHDKKFYYINISQFEFINLMVTMLSKFKIININSDGIITNL
jgi:hypothetical protein